MRVGPAAIVPPKPSFSKEIRTVIRITGSVGPD